MIGIGIAGAVGALDGIAAANLLGSIAAGLVAVYAGVVVGRVI